jgi:ATP-dependent DNA ligase
MYRRFIVAMPKRPTTQWAKSSVAATAPCHSVTKDAAEKMVECRWLKPRLNAQIEYLEWTDGNHLRHSKFVALRDDQNVGGLARESPTTK